MTRFTGTAAAALVGVVLSVNTASAESGRYLMERIEEGFVRLDTQTGEVSLCQLRDEQIVCRLSADERYAFEDQIAILEERIEKLELSIAESNRSAEPVPTDDDIDKAMNMMEQMMRRFLGVIEEFDQRMSGDGEEGGRT